MICSGGLVALCAVLVFGCSSADSTTPASHTGACNAVAQLGDVVHPTCTTDPTPTMTGGTIAEGTYVLTTETYFGCSSPLPTSQSVTMVISGSAFESRLDCNGCPPTMSGTFTINGNELSMTTICPANVSSSVAAFTATESNLWVLFGNHQLQHTRL
jgi:hypothetical protein